MTMGDDDLWQDSILRNAYVGAWLLGLAFLLFPVIGVIRWPHWIWAAPISCAVLGLVANQRIRHASGRGETVVLGLLTLVFLVGAGALAKVAIGIAR